MSNNNVLPTDDQIATLDGKISPLLTVWRVLHYEVDRMARPTFDQNAIRGYWKNLTPVAVNPDGSGRYKVDMTLQKRIAQDEIYDGSNEAYFLGYMKLELPFPYNDSVVAMVTGYRDLMYPLDNEADIVVLTPFDFHGQTQGWFDLCDDDLDETLFRERIYGSRPVLARDNSIMGPAYAEAYITAFNDPRWNDDDITFELHNPAIEPTQLSPYAKIGEKKSIEGSDPWVKVTAAVLFQPGDSEDVDGTSGATMGYTPWGNTITDDLRVALYWEVIREDGNPRTLAIILAHEICHALGRHSHDPSGIMMAVPELNPDRFHPRSLYELRKDFTD